MSVIIVSADYIGQVIKHIRDQGDVPAKQIMHLLGCGGRQLHRYENGVDLIPHDVLMRVLRYALKMDAALDKE